MDKHLVFIRGIVCIACFLTLLWGCERQEEPSSKSREITKKIIITEPVAKKSQQPEKIEVAKSAVVQETATPIPESTPQMQKQPVDTTHKNVVAPAPPTTQKVKKSETATSVSMKAAGSPTPEIVPQVPKQSVDKAHKTIVASASPTSPKIKTPEISDLYNPEAKLNPFGPLFRKKPVSISVSKKKSKRRTPLTPLEKMDLSQLKLSGIILAPSGNRALVQETSGKGYVVKKGTYIGIHAGKIVEILEDQIIVEEEAEDIYGKVSIVKKSLKLQKPPGE
jgi:type IV pilus assembly protein PilP